MPMIEPDNFVTVDPCLRLLFHPPKLFSTLNRLLPILLPGP